MQTISEAHLLPVIEQMLAQFPFEILGFHADNGSEYVNNRVADMKRNLDDPVASSLRLGSPGPASGYRRLPVDAEAIIEAVLSQWLPLQRGLAHPMRNVTMEVRRICKQVGISPT